MQAKSREHRARSTVRDLALSASLAMASWGPSACHRDAGTRTTGTTTSITAAPPATATGSAPLSTGEKKCVVHLHGKGQHGTSPEVIGDVTHVRPDGNADGWSGKQWLYFAGAEYDQVRAIVANAARASSCARIIIHGFSNGAAAAGKLLCRGETFGGTTVGYILDDPVPDHGADGCKPPAGVKRELYWTGGLSIAVDGWSCGSADWTCEGGTTVGITRYAALLGVRATPSIHTTHAVYDNPPEETSWW